MVQMSENEIKFIGKITAGVTHEINNALASIKEISGLMEDIMSMSSDASFPHQEKFIKNLNRIREQVQRGVKLTTSLNKFSHLSDENMVQVELNDLMEHLVFLNQRFTRIKNAELSYKLADKPINFNTSPMQLQMAIYNCIAYLLKYSAEGGTISIHSDSNEELISIRIILQGEVFDKSKLFNDSSSSEELLILKEVVSSLNGNVEFDGPGQCINLKLIKKELI